MRVFVFLPIAFCFACANLTVYQPTAIQEIPEIADTPPARSWDVGTLPTVEYSATSDPSSRPFNFDPRAAASSAHYAKTRFPLSQENIEFAAGIYTTAGFFGSFKYQFWGPRLSQAAENDTSMALVLQATISPVNSRSGSGRGVISGGFPWEAKVYGTNIGGSLLYGYRLKKELLVYGGPYGSYTNVEAKVNQAEATDGTFAALDTSMIDYFVRYGPTLGTMLRLNPQWSVQLEGAYLLSHFGGSVQKIKVDPQGHLALILRFDNFIESTF